MAALAFSYAGAAVGNAVLPGIGGAIGGVLGSFIGGLVDQQLFGEKPAKVVRGSAMQDLRVQGSGYGSVIPVLYGRGRLGGNVIWMRGFEEEIRAEGEGSGGGKGGFGASSSGSGEISYHYYCDVAYALCQGTIGGVTRVWADGNIFEDENVGQKRVHTGSPGQARDPLIEAVEGASRSPAYRGLAYVVFERLYITPFGNRLPQFSFEIEVLG